MNESTKKPFPWSLDEHTFAAVTAYHEESAVAEYDQRMRVVRDVDGENRQLLDILARFGTLGPSASLLEIGTGTGALARAAAREVGHVLAVDVSDAMLRYAKTEAAKSGLTNIRFENAGFLSFDNSRPFDAIVSSLALHHINDVWKAEALSRVARALRPGGIFLLVDVIFDCQGGELDDYVKRVYTADKLGERMLADLHGHIASESSTLRWIMDGIITRSGLKIIDFVPFGSIAHLYTCQKPLS